MFVFFLNNMVLRKYGRIWSFALTVISVWGAPQVECSIDNWINERIAHSKKEYRWLQAFSYLYKCNFKLIIIVKTVTILFCFKNIYFIVWIEKDECYHHEVIGCLNYAIKCYGYVIRTIISHQDLPNKWQKRLQEWWKFASFSFLLFWKRFGAGSSY